MQSTLVSLTLLACCPFASAQQSSAPSIKLNPGFDVNAIDRTADPCVDFYQYSCGTWLANNPIPPDLSRYGRFDALQERNREILKGILERAAAKTVDRTPNEQKIGDYYAACMDQDTANRKKAEPIQPEMARLLALKDKRSLPKELALLHKKGTNALFRLSPTQDYKNATEMIAEVDQGGLGLPDRDYYFRKDPKSEETRAQYLTHVQRMFALLGDAPEKATANAQTVMAIETALAEASLDRVARRDPANVYHRMTVAELQKLSPSFNWPEYMKEAGAGSPKSLNVAVPKFFQAMDAELQKRSVDEWKTYLRWHLATANASLLSDAFYNENFDFRGRILTGAKEPRPLWKRCVASVDADLGEALGQRYVEETFGEQGKQRMLALVHALEKSLEQDIRSLPWMTPATKDQALLKLKGIANKIGYPETWRDYGKLRIERADRVANSLRSNEFEFARSLGKVGKPIDPKEWFMSPPTVNAYYDPQMNNINFPAGILQPPFFDLKIDDAVNFGGIGAVIGHELTHGFDDQGRQFDAKGNLRDWWTEADAKAFQERAECVVKLYGSFTAIDDVKLNGKLTLGENVADLGGLRVSYMALLDSLTGKSRQTIDNYTPEQRFFLAWGQVWCQNVRPEASRMQAQTDPHSPGKYRVNGVLSNMPEFREAFSCKIGQPMARQDACRIW